MMAASPVLVKESVIMVRASLVVLTATSLTIGFAAGVSVSNPLRAQSPAAAQAPAAQGAPAASSAPAAPGARGAGSGGRGGGAPALVDNDRLTVVRATQPAGMIEQPHTHPEADYLSIQLTPGDLVVTVNGVTTKGTPGMAWYLPKGATHTMNNVGTTPVDVVVVTLK
jgi:quercetin dioxygenase-like cupin family protein